MQKKESRSEKKSWRDHIFRKPSRRWWWLGALVFSVAMVGHGLGERPPTGFAFLPSLSALEGIGILFGALAELLPEEETTLAGVLRIWGGLFVGCGLVAMLAELLAGSW